MAGAEEERELLALFACGSEKAIELTQRRYGKLILTITRGVLQNESDAEECVNEVLFRLWSHLSAAKPKNLTAYVCRTARNCALDRKKSKIARGEVFSVDEGSDELCTLLAKDGLPEEKLGEEELARVMNAFLAGEKPETRKIFLWRFWFGLSAKEIAAHLGVSERAVHLRLAAAKEKMKKHLKKEGYAL